MAQSSRIYKNLELDSTSQNKMVPLLLEQTEGKKFLAQRVRRKNDILERRSRVEEGICPSNRYFIGKTVASSDGKY